MAGLRLQAQVTVGSASTTPLTLMQVVAPSNHRIKIEKIEIAFDGVNATSIPIQVEVLLQTTAGTSSSLTATALPPVGTETPQTTFLKTFTAEPTASTVLECRFVHPQSGTVFTFPPGRELWVSGGTRLGVRVNNTYTTAVSKTVTMTIEE